MYNKFIEITINTKTIKVNDDKEIEYSINPKLLELYHKRNLTPQQEKALGYSIYRAIFSTKEREELLTNSQNQKIALIIKTTTATLQNIPYELIAKRLDKHNYSYLLKDPNITLVRKPKNFFQFPIKNEPLKMLLIISEPLELLESAPIDPLREVKRIEQSLSKLIKSGFIELDIENIPTLDRLFKRFKKKKYDIIHYSGHGTENGELIFEDSQNPDKAYFASSNEIKEIFSLAQPKLIFLDSCEGAKSTIEASLAYKLSEVCAVIGNTSSITDIGATKIANIFYTNLERETIAESMQEVRALNDVEWYMSALFANPNFQLFDREKIKNTKPKEQIIEGINIINEEYYIYRYRLVRKASNILEEKNKMLIHGIAGAGKSTLANYLATFFKSKFSKIFFVDLKLEEINTPNELIELLNEYNKSTQKALEEIFDKKTLLILDNLEEIAQEKDGTLKPKWRRFFNKLFTLPELFTIITSRILPYINNRNELFSNDEILFIEEYENPDINLLIQHQKLYDKINIIENVLEKVGAHPLTLTKALSLNLTNLETLLTSKEYLEIKEFYENYFTPKIKALLNAPAFKKEDLEKILSFEELEILHKLHPYSTKNDKIDFFKLLRTLITPSKEDLEELKKALKKIDTFEANIFLLSLKDENHLELFLKLYDTRNTNIISKYLDINLLQKQIENQPKTKKAASLNNLATLLSDLGEYEKAKEYFLNALDIYYPLAKENKAFLPDFAMTLNNLATLLKNLGEYEKAKEYYLNALDIYHPLAKENYLVNINFFKTLANYLFLVLKIKDFDNFIEKICQYFDLSDMFEEYLLEKTILNEDIELKKDEINKITEKIKIPYCKERVQNLLKNISYQL
ncbi:tetratricopeptide repeat protein [Caminibacter sp.]